MIASEILSNVSSVLLGVFKLMYWYAEALYRQFVPPSMKSIDGETILVTGAVGGIGREFCNRIVRSGSDIKLVLWDLNQVVLEKFAEELRILGQGKELKVFPFAVDISKRENIDGCCQKVKDTVGPVTIIFNNAGICPTGNILLQTNEQINSTIQVNLMSHLWIIRQFLPEMIATNHGRIVNTCSFGGLKASQHALPYFASKFAVNGYSEALKMELEMFHNDGIHVTTVYPYVVKTPLIRSLDVNKDAKLTGVVNAIAPFLEPEDVAKQIVEGMRREYEYVYCPHWIPLFILAEWFIPLKFRKFCHSIYFDMLAYKDPQHQKHYYTSFSHAIKSKNGNGKEDGLRRNSKAA